MIDALLPQLWALTDDRVIAEGGVAERAREMAHAGGSRFAVGLRSTTLTDRGMLALAAELGGVALGISGRADLARAAGAGFVLKGRGALPAAELRTIAPSATIIASVHHASELDSDADAFLAGAIFEKDGRPGAGPGLIEAAARTGKPVIAIGGVTPANAAQVIGAGAWGVAAIRALWDAGNPGETVASFLAVMPEPALVGVTINGQPKRAAARATLAQLLAELSLDPRAVVVEHNREIVRREQLGARRIAEGDALEIVHFVGGG